MNEQNRNDLQLTISHVLQEMKSEIGDTFNINKINLAELERRTGISRKRLRKLKKDGFIVKPHGNAGLKKTTTVLTGFTDHIDTLLRKGVDNSTVVYERLLDKGYQGSLTTVKEYIHAHRDLIPVKRTAVIPKGNRGRRYTSDPGESYQMDWGFLKVEQDSGNIYNAACFAMICHCCGERYVEFFPNAKQENLFIGMLHAFRRMGVPQHILTDNMKSVTPGRDSDGRPLWNKEYASFMTSVGFETRLCKPRHPFTKGAVERLVKFVKHNFMAGRTFGNLTDLNYEALKWCDQQNTRYHDGVFCIPHQKHQNQCLQTAKMLVLDDRTKLYLWPRRHISFDGFVTFEGRRFGVPYRYTGKICRVSRQDFTLYIYSDDLKYKLVEHDVTWSRRDSYCEDQFDIEQPEEFPTTTITTTIHQTSPPENIRLFSQFDFDKEVEM